jgi:hypothetical protein
MTEPRPENPKAAAKAAKAYAKATRPWFKKKRFIIPIAVVAVVAIAAAGTGGDKSGGDGTGRTKSSVGSASKVGSKSQPAPPGTWVRNKSAKYAISKVEVVNSIGPFSQPPAGKYVVVTLTVENVKNSTIQISNEDFKLLVGGSQIDSSSDAYMMEGAFAYDDLSPQLKRTGKIVFDVAPKYAGTGVLRAQAFISADDAVFLSLK